MRLTAAATSPSPSGQGRQENSQNSLFTPTNPDSTRHDSGVDDDAHGDRTPSFDNMVHGLQESTGGSSEDQSHADRTGRGVDTRNSSERRREGADHASEKIAGSPSGGSSSGQSMLSACESDIWAWALMVLRMFSDELWPPGNGQVQLLLRCTSVQFDSSAPSDS